MKMQQEQQRKKAAESSAALAQQPPPPPRDFTHAMLLQEAQQGFSPSLGMQMRHFAEEKAAEIEKIPLPPPPEVGKNLLRNISFKASEVNV